jgi:predicted enzyme related to lactoylglutathione lyase
MVNRVIELGGRVDVFPYDTELGRIARVADPCGASFALVDPAARIPEPIRCIADEAGRLSS